jgi:hypothetical protein
MPITRKHRDEEASANTDEANGQHTYTAFVHKPRWFVISQTTGDEFAPPRMPEWDADRALAALDIERIAFTDTDGNCQGYARKRQIAINPVAQLPHKTLFHEAEAVAMLCCEALNLEGADYCRGYIQNWLCPALGYNGDAIPEKSAQKILRSADQILRAGRLQPEKGEQGE